MFPKRELSGIWLQQEEEVVSSQTDVQLVILQFALSDFPFYAGVLVHHQPPFPPL